MSFSLAFPQTQQDEMRQLNKLFHLVEKYFHITPTSAVRELGIARCSEDKGDTEDKGDVLLFLSKVECPLFLPSAIFSTNDGLGCPGRCFRPS